jgi:hypothetical protein
MSGSNSLPPVAGPSADQPLGLTVHGMPSPQDALGTVPQRRLGRWKMTAVLLICAAPVIASYLTYYVIRPEGRRNFGELITPQRPTPAITSTDLQGNVQDLRNLKGQWLLVSVAGGACNTACEQNLYLQRQIRESLGKEKDRLDWVWLIPDDVPVPAALKPALTQATLLRVQASQLKAWLAPATGQQLADHLYVVDPMGNWMMRLPAQLDKAQAPKAKNDLSRLLRASSSWDIAGRADVLPQPPHSSQAASQPISQPASPLAKP